MVPFQSFPTSCHYTELGIYIAYSHIYTFLRCVIVFKVSTNDILLYVFCHLLILLNCFFRLSLLLFSKVMELASAEWTPSHMNFLDLSLYSYKFVESNHMFLFLSTLKNSILKKDN